MAQRVTLRKRTPYNTTSNRRRIVKTPGGKLVYHHIKKLATAPKCGDCGIALPGVRLFGVHQMFWLPTPIGVLGSCSPPKGVRHYFQDKEDCPQGVRWFEMCGLC